MNEKNIRTFYNHIVNLNNRSYKYKLNIFEKTNDIDRIKDILKKINLYIDNNKKINVGKKKLLFERKYKLFFYPIYKLYSQYAGHILFLNILNDRKKLKNFHLSILNVSIKPCYNKKMLNKYKIKGFYSMSCKNTLYDLPFIFYYITNPQMANNNFKGSYEDTINNLIEKGNSSYSINKLLFRGSSNNKYRKHLFSYYKDKTKYIDFKDTKNKNNYIQFED